MAMCVCKYVFNKQVIGWGCQARIQVFIIEGRPVLARSWQGLSPPEAPGN